MLGSRPPASITRWLRVNASRGSHLTGASSSDVHERGRAPDRRGGEAPCVILAAETRLVVAGAESAPAAGGKSGLPLREVDPASCRGRRRQTWGDRWVTNRLLLEVVDSRLRHICLTGGPVSCTRGNGFRQSEHGRASGCGCISVGGVSCASGPGPRGGSLYWRGSARGRPVVRRCTYIT